MSTEAVFIPTWERRHEPCSKTAYTSQKQARRAARTLNSEKGLRSTPMRAYFDPECGTWHLTTKPMRAQVRDAERKPSGPDHPLKEIAQRTAHIRSMVPVVIPMNARQHAAFAASRYGQSDGGSLLLMDIEGGNPQRLTLTDDGLGGAGPILRLHPNQRARLGAMAAAQGMDLSAFVVGQVFTS